MKRVFTGISISIAAIVAIIALSMRYTYYSNDPNDYPEIVDRKPLRYLKNEQDAKYVLVRIFGDKIEYIDDFSLLVENKDVFIVTNPKSLYFTTSDGYFELYKNGERVDGELFSAETININYGTLQQAFAQTSGDELEMLLAE